MCAWIWKTFTALVIFFLLGIVDVRESNVLGEYCYETRVCQDDGAASFNEEIVVRVNRAISKSCLSIRRRFLGQKIPDGIYQIFPFGNATGVDVVCDMKTDGGGWTLISQATGKAYNKVNFPNPLTAWYNMEPNYFLKSSAVGKLQTLLQFTQIRFKCSKPDLGKYLDLASSTNSLGAQVVRYFTGKMARGTFPKACGSFIVLPDDSSTLSRQCSQWGRIAGKYKTGTWGHDSIGIETRLVNHALFIESYKHFLLEPGRWECDDVAVNVAPKSDDYWKIFVR